VLDPRLPGHRVPAAAAALEPLGPLELGTSMVGGGGGGVAPRTSRLDRLMKKHAREYEDELMVRWWWCLRLCVPHTLVRFLALTFVYSIAC
jgi:hypothetical protein